MIDLDSSLSEIQGNKTAFIIFELINYVLLGFGILIFIAGIYMISLSIKAINLDYFIIFLGTLIIALGIASFFLKKSLSGLIIYISSVLFIFTLLIIGTLFFALFSDHSLQYLTSNLPSDTGDRLIKQANSHHNLILISLYFSTFICVFFKWFKFV